MTLNSVLNTVLGVFHRNYSPWHNQITITSQLSYNQAKGQIWPNGFLFFSPSQETLINFIWRNSQIFLATAANVLPSSSFLLIIPNYSQQFFVKKKYLIRSWATRILILIALYASVSSYPWNVIIIILTILNYFLRFKWKRAERYEVYKCKAFSV